MSIGTRRRKEFKQTVEDATEVYIGAHNSKEYKQTVEDTIDDISIEYKQTVVFTIDNISIESNSELQTGLHSNLFVQFQSV